MKLTRNKIILILLGIIVVATILRFWNLSSVPPSLDWDEASWGYNAYSILTTGRDEYGKLLPVVVRSFNDYKPALYAYLSIPGIVLFGLTDFAVRFPNALFGVFAVITTYFLVKELFRREGLALLSTFLMAISPWAIQFSRFAHEGMVGLVFNLLMALFFVKGIKKPIFLSLSAACAAMSLYSYQNEKVFVPLLGIALLISFWQDFWKIPKKYLVNAFVVGAIISLPIVFFTFTTPEAFSRAKGASFIHKPTGFIPQNFPQRGIVDIENRDYPGLVMDNRRVVYLKTIVDNYLSHFDPNFLFVKGDIIPRHQPPGMGHLYLVELPFFLVGIYFLLFGNFDKRIKKFLILWMLIVPIPASITWDVPNAGRTMNFLPVFQIIVGIGLIFAYSYLLKFRKSLKTGAVLIFAALAVFNFSYYLNQYFSQYGYYDSTDWQYGYNQIIPEVEKLYPKYKKIIVSNEIPLDQSYIFFLYHLKYPAKEYQKHSTSGEYKITHKFDKFEFRMIRQKNWENSDSSTLFISSPNDFPPEADRYIIKRITFADGTISALIVAGK